jgi:hypothetical protein
MTRFYRIQAVVNIFEELVLDRKPQAMQTCEIRDLLLYELDTRAYRACFISSTVLSGLHGNRAIPSKA